MRYVLSSLTELRVGKREKPTAVDEAGFELMMNNRIDRRPFVRVAMKQRKPPLECGRAQYRLLNHERVLGDPLVKLQHLRAGLRRALVALEHLLLL